MKITSKYREEETVLYDGNVVVIHHKDSCVIRPRRHHNKREKFIHVELSTKDLVTILAKRIGDKMASLILRRNLTR